MMGAFCWLVFGSAALLSSFALSVAIGQALRRARELDEEGWDRDEDLRRILDRPLREPADAWKAYHVD